MRISVAGLVIFLIVLPVVAGAQVPIGGEFQVNAYTTSDQLRPSVAAHPDGGFVVAWMSRRPGGPGWHVVARRYHESGDALDPAEFGVNSSTTVDHQNPEVAALSSGGFVATWSRVGAATRPFDASGAPMAPETIVATSGVAPSVAAGVDNGFVVAWHEPNFIPGPRSIHARLYDAAATPQSADLRVDSAAGYPWFTSVASDAAGNFVVAWDSFGQDGHWAGVFARRYDALGNPLGPEFQVNTYTTGNQEEVSVAMNAEGRFVIVWKGAPETSRRGIFGRRYDAAGVPEGPEFAVSLHSTLAVSGADVAVNADGSFLVSWDGWVSPSVSRVFARAFYAGGVPGSQFEVSSYTTTSQGGPSVSSDGAGAYVIAWTGAEQDGDATGIFARRFGPALVFADGFESGGLSAWSASAGGSDLLVTPEAAMGPSSAVGLQGNVNDTQALWVQDDSPRGEHFYSARFYFDPGDFDPGEAEGRLRTRLFVGFDSNPTRRLFAVVLRRLGGEYSLMARTRRHDGTRLDTGFVPIAPGARLIDLRWTRSSGVDTADGTLELWVDAVPTVVGGIDNDQGALDFVRLGALSVKAGASGTMYWDEFESQRALIYSPAASAR
jgi:hypothetical protein